MIERARNSAREKGLKFDFPNIQIVLFMIDASTPLDPLAFWMRKALDLAIEAFDADEVPVGAIVVQGDLEQEGRVIGEGFNQRELLQDPTAHAEMIALTQAANALGSWRLIDCTLFVTLEPCPMCAGAIVQARMPRVVYGTVDQKAGACHTLYQVTSDPRLNHRATVIGGVMAADSQALLREFFARKRAMGKK